MQTLRLFYDVTRFRSFSRAAVEHGITQSAASQRIGQLEKRLGVRLIDRSIRPLALTPAGEVFLTGCRDVVERYEQLEHKVTQFRPQLESRVQVQAIYSAGIELLTKVKDAMAEKHPRVSISFKYTRPDEVHEAVRKGMCDVGIVSYPERWRDVASIRLADELMVGVCRAGHELGKNEVVKPEVFEKYPMVSFEQSLPVGRRIKRYLRENGSNPKIVNTFDNVDTIKGAVGVTDQVSILPERLVRREVEAGTLSAVKMDPPLSRQMGVIYRKRNQGGRGDQMTMTLAVEAFIKTLLEFAGPESVAGYENFDSTLIGQG